jgi:hypothetical protein
VIFVDEVDKSSWKDPKDTTVASEEDDILELPCFTSGRDEEHPRLSPELILEDLEKFRAVLQNSQVLSTDEVNRKLLAIEEERDFEPCI